MSDPVLIFHSVIPLPLIITVLGIIMIGLIWREAIREVKFKGFRILAVVLMISGLAGIILRPSVRSEKISSILLLTPGYNKSQVDSLRRADPSLSLYRTPDTAPYDQATALKSYQTLSSLSGSIRYVAGEGLPLFVLEDFKDTHFTFLPSGYPSGIIELHSPDKVIVNQRNIITGVYNNTGIETKLLLEGPGGKEDSCVLEKPGLQKFTLIFKPKQEGRFLYHMITRNGGEEKKENFPIEVIRKQSLNILFIQQYPTFETQYLKSFSGKQHSVLLRYQVSKNIFRYEALNRPHIRIGRLTSPVLREFDLLFIDSDSYAKLSVSEKNILETSIEDGLGVIILFNDDPLKMRNIRSLLPLDWKPSGIDTAQFSLNGKKISLPVWPVVTTGKNIIIPVAENKSRILSGVYPKGFGKIGFSLLQETYRLALEGDSVSYSNLWTGLIDEVAGENQNRLKMRVAHTLPVYPDEPLSFQIITSGSQPNVFHNTARIPVSEDVMIDDVWHGKIWSPQGWHRLDMPADSTGAYYFVSNPSEWRSLRSVNNIKSTLSINFETDSGKKSGSPLTYDPLSPTLFFLVFLIAAGFLWLFPKL